MLFFGSGGPFWAYFYPLGGPFSGVRPCEPTNITYITIDTQALYLNTFSAHVREYPPRQLDYRQWATTPAQRLNPLVAKPLSEWDWAATMEDSVKRSSEPLR